MPARVVAVTALLLLAGAASLAAPASASLAARGPILIHGDGGFTAANGVVAGTGTPADPFVIAGWHIVATSGNAIEIRYATSSFVVRGNLLEARSPSGSGVVLTEVHGARMSVESNEILYHGTGMLLTRADANLTANEMLAKASGAKGIVLEASKANVRGNIIDAGAVAVSFRTWGPVVEGNTITASAIGVDSKDAYWATIHGNRFDRVGTGVASGQGLLNVTSNTFVNGRTGVSATGTAQLRVSGNAFDGLGADAVVTSKSTVTITGNTVVDGLGRGFVLADTTGTVTSNSITRTSGAITLAGQSEVRIQFNSMANNVYGLSVPYAARASIPHLLGNVVNGVNVDGVYHWRQANLVYTGLASDAGFSAGFYGALTLEGHQVFYDVDTALIQNSVIRGGTRGVTAVNSFNIQIRNSTIVNVLGCGVFFEGTIGFVKNTTIIIDIDPPQTCGVEARGGFVGVFNNTIVRVDVGVRFDANVRGEISGNVVLHTLVGLHLSGAASQTADAVVVLRNELSRNSKGMVLVQFKGTVSSNEITLSGRAAVELQLQARPRFVYNNVSFNNEGIVDAYSCVTIAYQVCSGIHAEGNVIGWNNATGLRVNGTATLRANLIVGNVVGADLRGGANLSANVIRDNQGDGARVRSWVHARGDTVIRNGDAGFRFSGTTFIVLQANISANFHGIVVVDDLPSPALPGVTVKVPGTGDVYGAVVATVNQELFDPLHVHLTVLERNRGDAIRASPWTIVNATHNWWGTPGGPRVNVGDTVGAFQNGVTAGAVTFTPWWQDRQMTTTGPVPGL